MSTAFEDNLREQLEAQPKLRRKAARILAILNARPSKRRTRRIAAMERHAKAELTEDNMGAQFAASGEIDWSAVEWQTILLTIVQVLLALLPFLLLL